MSRNAAISHHERFSQRCSFAGLVYARNIRPTDIDVSIDFGGKMFVFIEAKHSDCELPDGQRIHLENLVKAIRSDCVASALLCSHSSTVYEDIDIANSIVTKCFTKDQKSTFRWYDIKEPVTVKESIERLLNKHGMGEYITHDLLSESSEQQQTTIAASQNSGMADGVDLSAAELEMFEGVMGYPAMWICYQSEIDSFRSKLRRDSDEK